MIILSQTKRNWYNYTRNKQQEGMNKSEEKPIDK